MVETLLLLLVIASWLYWLTVCLLVRSFCRPRGHPLPAYTPPISILKPVKGLDPQAFENFSSFCRQEYPTYEILFGVAESADPCTREIQRLQREFPERSIRLLVVPTTAPNRKAGLLGGLSAAAQHDVLVICDSDTRVAPSYLRRVVAPLADEKVGMVTCPYRGQEPLSWAARLEALHMGVTFLPSVLAGRGFLGMRFALGSTMCLRRSTLEKLGGFDAVAEYLAEDYQLGARVAALGLRVHLSSYIVPIVLCATSFREQWDRELRWMRCTRVSRPREYPGLALTFSVPLAATLAVLAGFASLSMWVLILSLVIRWLSAWLIAGYTEDDVSRQWLAWLPARDFLSAFVWVFGAVGRRVTWRGEAFLVQADGRMLPAPPHHTRDLLNGLARRPTRR